jgi:hypothetical protein
VDPVEAGAWHRELSRLGSCGEQQRVVGELLAAGQGDGGGVRVDRLRHRVEAQLDLLLAVEGLVVDVGLLPL